MSVFFCKNDKNNQKFISKVRKQANYYNEKLNKTINVTFNNVNENYILYVFEHVESNFEGSILVSVDYLHYLVIVSNDGKIDNLICFVCPEESII